MEACGIRGIGAAKSRIPLRFIRATAWGLSRLGCRRCLRNCQTAASSPDGACGIRGIGATNSRIPPRFIRATAGGDVARIIVHVCGIAIRRPDLRRKRVSLDSAQSERRIPAPPGGILCRLSSMSMQPQSGIDAARKDPEYRHGGSPTFCLMSRTCSPGYRATVAHG
jgi:hypothetical protein